MNLFDLKEEQLSDYIESSLKNDPHYQLARESDTTVRKYSSCISKTISSCEKYIRKMKSAEALIHTDNMDAVYKLCLETAEEMQRTVNILKNLPIRFGYRPGCDNIPNPETEATFDYGDNGIIHVVLPELLPKRLKYNASTGKYENRDAQATFKSRYQKTFYNEYQNGKHRICTNKVFLFIINYFEDKSSYQDHDNLDAKAFQDMLATLYLLDDNPEWCATASDSKIGPNHTEAYIIPYELFPDFLKKFYLKNNSELHNETS